jgi:hypothetical protein
MKGFLFYLNEDDFYGPDSSFMAGLRQPIQGAPVISDSSGRFQSRQIDFPLLARKRDLSSDAALVLLHAGDAMVPGIIHLDFAVAGIDREALLIAKKCVAPFVLTAG